MVFLYSIKILWGTCGCVKSQWIELFFKGTFIFSCTYILSRYLWNIIPTDNSIKVFVFLSKRILKRRTHIRKTWTSEWISTLCECLADILPYTTVRCSVTVRGEERVYSIMYMVNVVYSTTRPMAILVLEFQARRYKISKVKAQGWMGLKETSLSFKMECWHDLK